MFTIFGITITLSQIMELIPKIGEAIKIGQSVYTTLVKAGSDTATQQSITLLGKAVGRLITDVVGPIPLPHKMTPEEEQLWFEHAQGTA